MVDVAGVVAAVVVDGLGNATVGVVVADFVAVNAFVVAIVVVQALVCKCDR